MRALRRLLPWTLLVAAVACSTLTPGQEKRLGDDLAYQTQASLPLVRDPYVLDYVEDIAAEVLRAAGPQPFTYRFYVVQDPDVNAFAMPGGHIYINTGTILMARNVSELSGVIAHEIGHVVLRHLAENYSRQQWANIGRQAAVLGTGLVGGPAGAVGLAGDLTALGVLNSFGREAEREADGFAIEVLPRAGYDPQGMVTFFQTLANQTGGAGAPTFLSSHPATAERIADANAAVAIAERTPGLRRDDGGKLEIIQRRIRLLTEGAGRR